MPPDQALCLTRGRSSVFAKSKIGLVFGAGFAHPRGSLVAGPDRRRGARPALRPLPDARQEGRPPTRGGDRRRRDATAPSPRPVRDADLECAASGRFGSGERDADLRLRRRQPENSLATDPFAAGRVPDRERRRDPGAATYRGGSGRGRGLHARRLADVTARMDVTGEPPQLPRAFGTSPERQPDHGPALDLPPRPSGRQTFQLHPQGWHFAEGHVPKLELLGRDFPYMQASTGTFALTAEDVVFELPVREPPDGELIEPYAPAALELTLAFAKRQRALRAKKVRLRAGCPRENCTLRMAGAVEPRRGATRRRSAVHGHQEACGRTAGQDRAQAPGQGPARTAAGGGPRAGSPDRGHGQRHGRGGQPRDAARARQDRGLTDRSPPRKRRPDWGRGPASPAGPDLRRRGGLAVRAADRPLCPGACRSCASTSARSSSSSARGASSARSSGMRGMIAGDAVDHQPPRPRALALHRQARAGAVADRRVAAAADRRAELGADRDRPAPHAPAQAAAAAVPRRGDRALRADDRRRRRARDRPLAGRASRSRSRRACRRSRST